MTYNVFGGTLNSTLLLLVSANKCRHYSQLCKCEFYRQTSSLLYLNCHFRAIYVTLLHINVHFKPYIFSRLHSPLNNQKDM